jgi:hypothetical protein
MALASEGYGRVCASAGGNSLTNDHDASAISNAGPNLHRGLAVGERHLLRLLQNHKPSAATCLEPAIRTGTAGTPAVFEDTANQPGTGLASRAPALPPAVARHTGMRHAGPVWVRSSHPSHGDQKAVAVWAVGY